MNFIRIIIKLLKILIQIFLGFCIISILATIIYLFFNTKSIAGFCDSIKTADKITDVFIKAKQQELFFLEDDQKIMTGEVYIFNQRSPFGRLACVISLENGKIIKTEQITAD